MESKGKAREYDVHWNETIRDLKQKVSTHENIDLVLGGKRLDNDEKWFEIEICDHKKHKDTTAEEIFTRWRTSAITGEEIPVLQVVNR